MPKITISIRIKDFGQFHGLLAKFQVQGDQIFIRYGFKMDEGFYPCAVIINKTTDQVLLHKAGIGQTGDIKLPSGEWLKVLKGLFNTQLFNYYSELINGKKAA